MTKQNPLIVVEMNVLGIKMGTLIGLFAQIRFVAKMVNFTLECVPCQNVVKQ